MEEFKPKSEVKNKRTMEFNGQQFEIDDLEVLKPKDIKPGDRIMIKTQSGNRYMIRWSKSANAPKIYSERTNFQDGYELANKYKDGEAIARVGESFQFTMITNKEKNLGTPFTAEAVTDIEIRRGIDKALEEASKEAGFGDMANMLKKQFEAKANTEDD